MAEPTIQLGGGNWAGKSDNLLGYYKEGERFYKQDFTFSRSTTGTYTDSDGYIQEMPYNLLQQSNDFDTTWLNQLSGTIVGGQSGYDGTNNAWKLSKSAATFKSVRQVISTSGIQTLSAYLKADTLDKASFRIDTTSVIFVDFDLTNGTYSISGGFPTSANIQEVSNGWYRADVTFNESITNVHIYVDKSNATSGSIFVQNAQLVKGTSAKTYFPTTTRLNMPRVDYKDNSNGSLILEPQRTNLVTHSSELDNAAWTKSGTTITANNTTSPDGTTNADKIIASSGLSIKIAYQVKSSTNSVAHTVSAFYKADEYSYAFLRVGGQTPSPYVIYNLSNQSVISTANATSTKIEDYGSGWYRVSMTYTANSATNAPNIAFLPTSGYTLDSANQPSYNGDGSSGGYIYGVQLEANASYPTTLINTSGSSVTRNADVINNFTLNYGNTFSALFDFNGLGGSSTNNFIMRIGSTNPVYLSVRRSDKKLQFYSAVSGVGYFATTATQKIAISCNGTNWIWSSDGVSGTLTATGEVNAQYIRIASDGATGGGLPSALVNKILLFNTALTAQELNVLTTL